ncbi:Crp/Fnr family transcriptional regulator [Sphingomonas jatrophae]|nr:Crp/Fnr family transcriptional regulator [Sphingomonas jatrophae]
MSLAPVSAAEIQLLRDVQPQQVVRARREILSEGAVVEAPMLLLSGWAARYRLLMDGRRQILGVVLPGELLCHQQHRGPVALSSAVALTDVVLSAAPAADRTGNTAGLEEAYAVSAALNEHYLLQQIVRLGRMSALERIADWLLEVRERLLAVGLVSGNAIHLPVTQELIADTLGLTSVHVNRTIQTMRREGLVEIRGGWVTFLNVDKLRAMVDFRAPTFTRS